jgi:RNA polymerase sigma-70 factor (ECF subfamily)
MTAMSTLDVCPPDAPVADPMASVAAEPPAATVAGRVGAWWRSETEEQRRRRFEAEALPHMRVLYATACRLAGNPHDAEDLVQDTFLRAYRAFDSFTPGTYIRAWLFTILHRTRTDAFRRRGRAPQTVDVEECVVSVPAAQESLANGGELITRALSALPEVFRAAVVLRDVQEFSYDEIARILDVPIGTVMSRIHRGRALLRQSLADLRPR